MNWTSENKCSKRISVEELTIFTVNQRAKLAA